VTLGPINQDAALVSVGRGARDSRDSKPGPCASSQKNQLVKPRHKLTPREIFKRARPSYEGRLLGVIGDYHLNGMLQHPLLPSPADGRRDTVIVLDSTTCTGKYRKATRLALEGAEELALIASDAAL
jgi:hypothetical protein